MIKPILGTMTFGQQVDKYDAKKMVNNFLSTNNELDTAFVYNEGNSERILGSIFENYRRDKYIISTKVNPRISGKLDGKAVNYQVNESLKRMNLDYVDILYLHFPDPNTPIEFALESCNNLYKEGKIKKLGISNFPAWLVSDVYYKCKINNWLLPSVYQGMYNALNRNAEIELFDAIRAYGISYYAYNPLAGGILTGKYINYEDNPEPGRFTYRPNYKERYWKKSYFNEIEVLKKNCEEENISIVEAVFRWMVNHSKLNSIYGDGILIGATNINQLEENLKFIKGNPLSEKLVNTFEQLWLNTKIDSQNYFRYYKSKV